MTDPLQHAIGLDLASGAHLMLHYFSDRELRWIFSYDYVGLKELGKAPEVVNKVRLVADYADGLLAPQLVLSMHVILPSRLGMEFLAGLDISPGAKTYLEFSYTRIDDEYRLIEICKGARDRVQIRHDLAPALARPIDFPFPVPDRIPMAGCVQMPFRLNNGDIAHFDLPERTLR